MMDLEIDERCTLLTSGPGRGEEGRNVQASRRGALKWKCSEQAGGRPALGGEFDVSSASKHRRRHPVGMYLMYLMYVSIDFLQSVNQSDIFIFCPTTSLCSFHTYTYLHIPPPPPAPLANTTKHSTPPTAQAILCTLLPFVHLLNVFPL